MITSKDSLFPDYYYFENGRTEIQAAHIVEMLRRTDIEILATNAERRKVIRMLKEKGISNVMQAVGLSETEVRQWKGAGPLFIDTLKDIRNEALQHPEETIARWQTEMRAYVFPDDLEDNVHEHDSFFGKIWKDTPGAHPTDTEYAESLADPSSPVETYRTTFYDKEHGNSVKADIEMLEKSILGALEILEKRWKKTTYLKAYFIEGRTTPAAQSRNYGQISNMAWRHLLNRSFLLPLMKGEAICGVRFSEDLLQRIPTLTDNLRYRPAEALEALKTIRPERFLHILGLTLLQRTSTESFWTTDFIVPTGEVQRCRHTLRTLFCVLQNRVTGCKEKTLKKLMQELSAASSQHLHTESRIVHPVFLHHLLLHHPWIEEENRGYRLAAEILTTEIVRIARIVYDAKRPITTADITTSYISLYTESPRALNFTKIHNRFPHIKHVARGIWRYK